MGDQNAVHVQMNPFAGSMLGEYSAYCGNPTPSAMAKPRQHPGQRPLPGQVVNGRYLPLSAAALDRSSSGPRQSQALGPPGGRGRERSLKGWARGRRGVCLGERHWIFVVRRGTAPPTPREEWRCYTCGQNGHLACHRPGAGDVSMHTASPSN
ncbi:unnamed protein product [Boreogadus saida]